MAGENGFMRPKVHDDRAGQEHAMKRMVQATHKVIQKLLIQLDGKDPGKRSDAAYELGRTMASAPPIIPMNDLLSVSKALAKATKDKNDVGSYNASRGLCALATKQLLKKQAIDPRARKQIIDVMVPALVNSLDDLTKNRSHEWWSILPFSRRKPLGEQGLETRNKIIETFGTIGDARAISTLVKYLHPEGGWATGTYFDSRLSAIKSLYEIAVANKNNPKIVAKIRADMKYLCRHTKDEREVLEFNAYISLLEYLPGAKHGKMQPGMRMAR